MDYYLLSQGFIAPFSVTQSSKSEGIDQEMIVSFLRRARSLGAQLSPTSFLLSDKWDVSRTISLYKIIIPKHFKDKDVCPYIAEALYHLTPLPHRPSGDITFVDLYLATPNLLQQDPAPYLLRRYSMSQLFLQFGRMGNWLVNPDFNSYVELLRDIKTLSIIKYGILISPDLKNLRYIYFVVEGNRLSAKVHSFPKKEIFNYPLPLMTIIRFYHLLSGGGIDVRAIFPELEEGLQKRKADIQSYYFHERENHNYLEEKHLSYITTPSYVPILTSEDDKHRCLGCQSIVARQYFPRCGHSICFKCQLLISLPHCLACQTLYSPRLPFDESFPLLNNALHEEGSQEYLGRIKTIIKHLCDGKSHIFDLSLGIHRPLVGNLAVEHIDRKMAEQGKYTRMTRKVNRESSRYDDDEEGRASERSEEREVPERGGEGRAPERNEENISERSEEREAPERSEEREAPERSEETARFHDCSNLEHDLSPLNRKRSYLEEPLPAIND